MNCRTFFHKAHVVLNKHECDRKLPQEPNSKPEFNHRNGYSACSCNTFTFSKLPIFKQRSMHRLTAQCHTRERDILCVTPRKATSWGSNLCKFHSNIFLQQHFFSVSISSSDSRFDIPTSRKPSSISDPLSETVVIMRRREQAPNPASQHISEIPGSPFGLLRT